MKLGIFSKVYKDYELEEAFSKVKAAGLENVQFNFANVGLDSLPSVIPDSVIKRIKQASDEIGISIPVVSGTFNTLELDDAIHRENIHNFAEVVKAAAKLGIPCVSISTGSFNQDNFWHSHPENHSEKGWSRLFHSLDEMLTIATENKITIVVEPEQANVVSTVEDMVRLMNHYDNSPYLKVLFDAANMITPEDANDLEGKVVDSLTALKDSIAIAHCKDCYVSNEEVDFRAVGMGNLPLGKYLSKLSEFYDGPVIMHGLEEEEVAYAMESLNENKGCTHG